MFGILNDAHLKNESGPVSHPETSKINHITQLFDLAEKNALKQLWLVPGSIIYNRLVRQKRRLFHGKATDWNFAPKQLNNVVTAWRDNARCQIILPGAVSKQWALDELKTTESLGAAVWRLRSFLGVYPSTPTRTGRLLANQYGCKGLLPTGQDYEPIADIMPNDFAYLKKPTKAARGMKYIHCFDKKNMYLSCMSLPLGHGPFREVEGEKATVAFQQKLLGAYLLKIEKKKPAWFWTPEIAIELKRQGWGAVSVKKAFVWDESKPALAGVYKAIRGALENAESLPEAERKAVRACLKSVYTHFIGWLAHEPERDQPQPFYRPDWRALIISEARARLTANLKTIAQIGGIVPLGVRVDAVLFFSDSETVEGKPLTGENASFRHVYSFPASHVLEMLDLDYSIHAIDDELKHRWGQQYGG